MKQVLRSTAALAALAVLAFGLAAGCGKSSNVTSPLGASSGGTPQASTSVAAATAFDAATRDLQAADSTTHGPCMPIGLPLGIPSGCAYDAAAQAFVCSEVRPDGITDTHSYQFRDGSGTPQPAYDSLLTASIVFASHLSGTSTAGRWHTVDDQRSLTETGLAGSETTRTFNGGGTSARADSVYVDGTGYLINRNSATTVTDVVVPAPFGRTSWPLSGTITTHVTITGGAESVDLLSQLTFNGTQFATLKVGDSTFVVNLASPPPPPRLGPPPGSPPPGGSPGDSTGTHNPPPPPPPGGSPGDSTGAPPPPPPIRR